MMRLLFLVSAFFVVGCGAQQTANTETEGERAEVVTLPNLTGSHVWSVDSDSSGLQFLGHQEGAMFEGHFDSFDVAVRLNPDDLSTAEIHAIVDMTSFEANDDERNDYLPAKAWFNLKEFPRARFVSTSVRKNGDGSYTALGALSIKDVSQNIELPFSLVIDDNQATASGEFALDRSEYHVGTGYSEEEVSNEVRVKIRIFASRRQVSSNQWVLQNRHELGANTVQE